jgi:hypothetical protein
MALIQITLERNWMNGIAPFTVQSNVGWLIPDQQGQFDNGESQTGFEITTEENNESDSREGMITVQSNPAGAWTCLLPVTQDGTGLYSLTYDLNGGSIANYDGGNSPGNYAAGTPIIMPTTVPTKEGNTFAGWLETTDIGELLMPGESSNSGMIDSGLHYVAQWTAAPATYPLTYDLDGGSIANYNGGTPPGNYVGGAAITMPTTVPTKDGNTFAGWLETTTIGETLMPGESSNSGMISGGLNYVAQWEILNQAVDFIDEVLDLDKEGYRK